MGNHSIFTHGLHSRKKSNFSYAVFINLCISPAPAYLKYFSVSPSNLTRISGSNRTQNGFRNGVFYLNQTEYTNSVSHTRFTPVLFAAFYFQTLRHLCTSPFHTRSPSFQSISFPSSIASSPSIDAPCPVCKSQNKKKQSQKRDCFWLPPYQKIHKRLRMDKKNGAGNRT